MKKKLLTISFAAAISMFNSADAVNWAAERAEQKDPVMDRLAIKAVTSLAEFAALPADRTERLNQNFVEDAKRANKRLTELSQVQTLAGLLPLTWLPPALTTDLTNVNTRITSLSGARNLSQLSALYDDLGDWLSEDLKNDLTTANTRHTKISGAETLSDLLETDEEDGDWLPSTLKTNLTTTNTRITSLSGARNLSQLSALYDDLGDWLSEDLKNDLTTANTRHTKISGAETLSDLLETDEEDGDWLPAALKSDLTTTNTRITSLSGAADLSQLLALDTSWLQPTLIQAIRRADIKLNHNLPDSLYENIDGIPEGNTIGVQIRTLRGASGQPEANDDVSKALEILYEIIVDQAHISSSDVTIDEYTLAGDGTDWYYALQNKIFSDVNSYTTENYLKFLSRILVDGKKTANDFSNIPGAVIPEIVYDLGRMIDCATDEDLGIAIEEEGD